VSADAASVPGGNPALNDLFVGMTLRAVPVDGLPGSSCDLFGGQSAVELLVPLAGEVGPTRGKGGQLGAALLLIAVLASVSLCSGSDTAGVGMPGIAKPVDDIASPGRH
jgi:hypothetical protein